MKLYVSNEGHYFAVADGRVIAHDVLPSDAPDKIRNAPQCSRDEFYRAVIAGLSQQLNDLGESLQRIAADGTISDRFVGTVCKFARVVSADFDVLTQAAEAENQRADFSGKMIRARQANDSERLEQLRAEMATVPVLDTRPRDRAGMPRLVRPTQPPTLRARDVGGRLGISPDAVMRLSLRNELAKPTYVDGSPLWRESDVDQYKEQHQ
jgi:hypothetical protein